MYPWNGEEPETVTVEKAALERLDMFLTDRALARRRIMAYPRKRVDAGTWALAMASRAGHGLNAELVAYGHGDTEGHVALWEARGADHDDHRRCAAHDASEAMRHARDREWDAHCAEFFARRDALVALRDRPWLSGAAQQKLLRASQGATFGGHPRDTFRGGPKG